MAPSKPRATDSRDPKVEEILKTHLQGGESEFTYSEVFPLVEVQRNPDSQSRLGTVDKRHVTELAEKLKAGVSLPPVVLWETADDGCVLVDGNHRVAAHIKRGSINIPAYVVKLRGGLNEAVYLSAVFNGANGLRLSTDELRRAVIAAGDINPEPSNARLAADYGVSPSQIGRIRAEFATGKRLEALSVAGTDSLTQGHLLPLAKITLNEPLKQAAALVIDAQMSATDTRELVKDLTAAGSESAQIERIGHERSQRAEDITAVAAGRKSNGSPTVDLRRMIGQFEKLLDTFPEPLQWVTRDPMTVALWAPRVTRVAEFLDELQAAYGQAVLDQTEQNGDAAA